MNLKIAVAPTAEIAIGIKTIDLKKASPLLSRSESQPTIRPINNVKKTTKTSHTIWFLIVTSISVSLKAHE